MSKSMYDKYICVGNCPELDTDSEPHCRCLNPEEAFTDYPDGCPCGNTPEWVENTEENRTKYHVR